MCGIGSNQLVNWQSVGTDERCLCGIRRFYDGSIFGGLALYTDQGPAAAILVCERRWLRASVLRFGLAPLLADLSRVDGGHFYRKLPL